MPKVRTLAPADWPGAEALYSELTFGPKTLSQADFDRVLAHPGTSVFGLFHHEGLCAMATLHLLPNVTWGGRPYALVENVVTAHARRGSGYGRMVMNAMAEAAWAADAYKIMLLTCQKRGAKGFYEACGFSAEDKYAMVMRRA